MARVDVAIITHGRQHHFSTLDALQVGGRLGLSWQLQLFFGPRGLAILAHVV